MRKLPVALGCKYCPQDGICELQEADRIADQVLAEPANKPSVAHYQISSALFEHRKSRQLRHQQAWIELWPAWQAALARPPRPKGRIMF